MNLLRKIQYCQYWNIGFCEQIPEELIQDKMLKPVKWLKHPFRDRWFADPFIYKVTDDEIVVFVEECPIENPKGIICELVIDRHSLRLTQRYVLLEKDTHLSYPAIIRYGGKVYVYPENGAAGSLYLYEYDEYAHRLINPVCILNESVADATIILHDDCFFLCATVFPETQRRAFLFKSCSLFGPYQRINEKPFQESLSCSRNGGNLFCTFSNLYRPAQDCSIKYGGALSIMQVNSIEGWDEKVVFSINPLRGRYDQGIHTINFMNSLCVVDGNGYYMPSLGKLYSVIRRMLK